MNDEKHFIIDPLTLLCKLALIYFMPNYTKISIYNHVLHLQVYTYYQWMERMVNGDNRRDISHLYTAILKMIKWYVHDNPEKIVMTPSLKNDMDIIIGYCIKGLHKTQTITYEDDLMIKILLQYFINLITDAISGILNDDNLLDVRESPYEPNILQNKIKNNYDPKMINSIAKMMKDADEIDSDSNTAVLVDCIHKLLLNRDDVFVKTMKDINTVL